MKYIFISFFILTLGFSGLLNPVRGVFQKVAFPIQIGLRDMGLNVKGTFEFLANLSKLRGENMALLEENAQLEAEVVELKKLAWENEALKDQLNVEDSPVLGEDLFLVNIMGNPSDLTRSSVLIDRGSSQGVRVGDVILRGNVLVGRVQETLETRSVVSLATSPNMIITVFDLDSGTEGVAVGRYGMYVDMTRILPSEEIHMGDTVVTSGKDGLFPFGLVVGRVTEVSEISTEPVKSARLESSLDLSDLKKGFLLKTL